MLQQRGNHLLDKRMSITIVLGTIVMLLLFPSCGGKKTTLGEAITNRDSLPIMASYGVISLISDSGVTRYRINTDEWLVYDKKQPSYWSFEKGVYLEQFDSLLNVDGSIKADTAYYYDREKLWKLMGHVEIKNLKQERYTTELLYWNQATKKIYTDKFIQMEQPDQTITGYGFESDDQFMQPVVRNIAGTFYVDEEADSTKTDSVK